MSGVREPHICLPCRRKFPSAGHLARHVRNSETHRKAIERREDKLRKRKKELIFAARALRQRIFDADDALQSQSVADEALLTQKGLYELQLQQLLGEYGMAQEFIENSRLVREATEAGADLPKFVREIRVGDLIVRAGVASWQSNKDVQEDRYMLDIELTSAEGLRIAGFAVLDGHSGSRCVEHVVGHFPGHLQRCLSSKPKLTDETLTKAVHEACVLCDDEFLKFARKQEILDGSTMILALVYPQDHLGGCKLMTACVGDSRAVLCRACRVEGAGKNVPEQFLAVPLSQDHKPDRPDERKRIESKGGIVDFEGVWRCFMPGSAKFGGQLMSRWGLAVSRSFGDLLLKEAEKFDCHGVSPGGLVIVTPEVKVMELQPDLDRFVVLASDGVWDVLSNEDAVAICAAQPDVELAAQRLLRHTYASNTDDNITALVFTWKPLE